MPFRDLLSARTFVATLVLALLTAGVSSVYTAPRTPWGGPDLQGNWLDSHDHAKGSMAWFVVDPPDGRIPALTAEARAAAEDAKKGIIRAPSRTGTAAEGEQER